MNEPRDPMPPLGRMMVFIDGENMVLAISLIATVGEVMSIGNTPAYRNLRWPDVQALANAESVGLSYSASRVELRFRAGS